MSKYRKKPVIIEAEQWLKHGDNPSVTYYADPHNKTVEGIHFASQRCEHCQKSKGEHGWIDTLEGGHIVCPGDFIITGVAGERYPCKESIFHQTYEPVED